MFFNKKPEPKLPQVAGNLANNMKGLAKGGGLFANNVPLPPCPVDFTKVSPQAFEDAAMAAGQQLVKPATYTEQAATEAPAVWEGLSEPQQDITPALEFAPAPAFQEAFSQPEPLPAQQPWQTNEAPNPQQSTETWDAVSPSFEESQQEAYTREEVAPAQATATLTAWDFPTTQTPYQPFEVAAPQAIEEAEDQAPSLYRDPSEYINDFATEAPAALQEATSAAVPHSFASFVAPQQTAAAPAFLDEEEPLAPGFDHFVTPPTTELATPPVPEPTSWLTQEEDSEPAAEWHINRQSLVEEAPLSEAKQEDSAAYTAFDAPSPRFENAVAVAFLPDAEEAYEVEEDAEEEEATDSFYATKDKANKEVEQFAFADDYSPGFEEPKTEALSTESAYPREEDIERINQALAQSWDTLHHVEQLNPLPEDTSQTVAADAFATHGEPENEAILANPAYWGTPVVDAHGQSEASSQVNHALPWAQPPKKPTVPHDLDEFGLLAAPGFNATAHDANENWFWEETPASHALNVIPTAPVFGANAAVIETVLPEEPHVEQKETDVAFSTPSWGSVAEEEPSNTNPVESPFTEAVVPQGFTSFVEQQPKHLKK
jgi:hypothetical protein